MKELMSKLTDEHLVCPHRFEVLNDTIQPIQLSDASVKGL